MEHGTDGNRFQKLQASVVARTNKTVTIRLWYCILAIYVTRLVVRKHENPLKMSCFSHDHGVESCSVKLMTLLKLNTRYNS